MTIRIIIFSIILSWASMLHAQQEDSIKKVFYAYQAALLEDRGTDAAMLIDTRTIAYYNNLCQLAIYGEKMEVQGLPLIDRIIVLGIRHRSSLEEIKEFDGFKMFVYAVNKGFVGKNSVADIEVGELTVKGDFAKGEHIAKGKVTPLFFHFYLEENQWKLNLTEMIPILNVMMAKMIKDQGATEDEYMLMIMEQMYGLAPDVDPWKPMAKKR